MKPKAEYTEAVVERMTNALRKADSIELSDEISMGEDGSVRRTLLMKVIRTVHQPKPMMGFGAGDTPKT